jgi:hypothetical protein
MLTFLSRSWLVPIQCCDLRRIFVAVFGLLSIVLLADAVLAQDFVRDDRQVARTWALHRIAVIQAANGDVEGAKNTVADINDPQYVSGPAVVTSVWFCNGTPMFHRLPVAGGCAACGGRSGQLFRDRSSDSVPTEVPRGLPANYLATDPRHGAVVDFRDECDSNGTRVTARRYVDGHTVIETPRPAKSRQ